MSDSFGSDNPLTVDRLQGWKSICQAKFLGFNAARIVAGTEARPTVSSPPTSEELRRCDDWDSRQAKAAGYLRSTLDVSQLAIIQDIDISDIKVQWNTLLSHYQAKTPDSRMLAIRRLMNLYKGQSGHENETFSEWGVRVVNAGNSIKNVLPDAPKVVPSLPNQSVTDLLGPGYTALNLVDDMIVNTISVGLGDVTSGSFDTRLQDILTFTEDITVAKALQKLENADNLAKTTADRAATATALAAKAKGPPLPSRKDMKPKKCTHHPRATSHTTDECSVEQKLKAERATTPHAKPKKDKKKEMAALATNSDSDSDSESPVPTKAYGRMARANVSRYPTSPSHPNTHALWNTDSGATRHMTSNLSWFRNMRPSKVSIQIADDRDLIATGEGSIVFQPMIDGRPAPSVVLKRVLYVPEIKCNLFSVFYATRTGTDAEFHSNDKKLRLTRHGKTLLTGTIVDNIGYLDGYVIPARETAFVATVTRQLLHKRLGHIGKGRLNTLVRLELADGIPVNGSEDVPDVCEYCIAGKQHRDPFPSSTDHRATKLLVLIHSDLHGPLPVTPGNQWKYWITFIDDHSRFKVIYLLRKKSDAFEAFKEYVAEVERKLGVKVIELRDDKGGEYVGNKFNAWCKERGITRQRTVRATPSQNGVAERLNRTLAEGVIAMLNQAHLPDYFWAPAVLYLANILNATPSAATSKTTSYEVWTGRKPDLRMHRVFGCAAYAYIDKKDRTGLASHTRKCIFIGFERGYKGWKLYNPKTRKVFVSRNVIFDETDFPGTSTKDSPDATTPLGIHTFWPEGGYAEDDVGENDLPPEHPANSIDTMPDMNAGVKQVLPPVPPNSPVPTADHADSPDPTFSPSWEEGRNTTGRPLTQLTPPRYNRLDDLAEPGAPERNRPSVRPPTPPSPTPSRPTNVDELRLPATASVAPQAPPHPSTAPKPHPIPAQGTRPIRPGRVMDYADFVRRGTKPHPRRQDPGPDEENDDEPRENALRGGEMADRGGAQTNERPPFQPDEGDNGLADAVEKTPIIDSVNYVYGLSTNHLDWHTGLEVAFNRVREKAFATAVRPEDSPKSFKEAMARDDAEEWWGAMNAEIDALIANGTWELVPLPEGRKAIGSRWVFVIKRNAEGEIDRYKARFVAQGFSQRPGIDFDEVFAPTARPAALRAILAQAALAGEHIESIDISNAYLNGELEKDFEVYMRQPEGFEQHGPDGQPWACRLVKGLYGLKQSGRLWYHKLGKVLEKIGFVQIKSGPSIYVWEHDGVRVIIPVHVDDVTITSRKQSKIAEVKAKLAKKFKIKDLGATSFLLGIKIDYDRKKRRLQLSQTRYIEDMLHRFNLIDCKPVTTPMDPGQRLSSAQSPTTAAERHAMQKVPYMSAVGALLYLAIGTRPDIAFAVGKLAQFNSNPGRAHWEAVKHLFRYLQGTKHLKLTYERDDSNPLLSSELFVTYSDADYAGDIDTRKSTSGYVVKMGTGAISWSSKKQTTVALSSTEAEYVAATAAGKELLWMRQLLRELKFKLEGPSTLLMDNQSALASIRNPEHHGRMKHLDVAHHWIRDEVQRNTIRVQYLDTESMVADILTKALPRVSVERHRSTLGLM